jgi:hypothetical protein
MNVEQDTTSTPRPGTRPIIEITGLHKWFGEFHVI